MRLIRDAADCDIVLVEQIDRLAVSIRRIGKH